MSETDEREWPSRKAVFSYFVQNVYAVPCSLRFSPWSMLSQSIDVRATEIKGRGLLAGRLCFRWPRPKRDSSVRIYSADSLQNCTFSLFKSAWSRILGILEKRPLYNIWESLRDLNASCFNKRHNANSFSITSIFGTTCRVKPTCENMNLVLSSVIRQRTLLLYARFHGFYNPLLLSLPQSRISRSRINHIIVNLLSVLFLLSLHISIRFV
jgi:hypothetical protein